MADEAIPRLFQLRTGEQLVDVLANGVLWTDGTVTVNWARATGAIENYSTLDMFGATVAPDHTVVWLRQDTYVDREV